jgi:hypothetical protein
MLDRIAKLMKFFLAALLISVLAASAAHAQDSDAADCQGYPGPGGACSQALVVVCTLDREVASTQALVVVFTPGLVAVCTLVLVVAFTLGLVVVCTLALAAAFIQDLPTLMITMLTMAPGAPALLVLRVQSG